MAIWTNIVLLALIIGGTIGSAYNSPYHYECEKGRCKKSLITEDVKIPLALSVCQLLCGEVGSLWPRPTGNVSLSNYTNVLNTDNVILSGIDEKTFVGQLVRENVEILTKNIKKLSGSKISTDGYKLTIQVSGEFNTEEANLTLDTSESYSLNIYSNNSGQELMADIKGASYFGIRHGLETLSQLIVYDDLHGNIKIIGEANITDSPAFAYRGLLLDTSRNYIDKAAILRTIEAMAMSKLNTFHWHIIDSHSFPYVSRTVPNMTKYGAYAPDKIYSEADVAEIVRFGLLKGVRILPEFDAPAHVGEGWQWVGENTTVCFKKKPYNFFCAEPPCGQLNPTSEKVYEILEGIYTDMLRDFKPDFFHMGGDEVNLACWRTADPIKNWMKKQNLTMTDANLYKLWDRFQTRAYDTLVKANGGKKIKVVLWTSALTNEENLKYLDPEKYIVQIWTDVDDKTIERLIANKFNVIFSNHDALYLDCGFSSWIGKESNNWCSPYKGWQKIYDNSPIKILKKHKFGEEYKQQVLGGETALWTEQVDSTSVDSRIWPRAAAFAERLWSNPSTSWSKAEQRMLWHRERLVHRGIFADNLEPEWCWQNQGGCLKTST